MIYILFFSTVVKHKQLPAIESVLKASNSNTVQRAPPIYALIICPTRELASQIAAEANVLLKYHDGIGVQILVGGTRFKDDQKRFESNPSQVYLLICLLKILHFLSDCSHSANSFSNICADNSCNSWQVAGPR